MARRMARHPALILTALFAAMTTGAIFVGSIVQVFLVGTSPLGLDSAVGLSATVAGALLSLAAVAFLVFAAFCATGEDDEDDGRGGDDEPPEPEDPSGEPVWWPAFERELAEYLSDRDRSRTEVRV